MMKIERPLSRTETPLTSAGLAAIGLVAGFVLLAGPGVACAADGVPDLAGVWSGKVEAGISRGTQEHEPHVGEPTFGNYDLTFTLTIREQKGRAVVGTWFSPNHSEQVMGVIRRNNKDLILVDQDSHFDGLLLSPTSMELCLAETHQLAMGAWCLRMEKQTQ